MVRWYLTTENSQLVIRGWPGNKRLPISEYRAIRHDETELKKLVLRLNAPLDAKTKVAFKHAFIDEKLLADYLDYLKGKIPTESSAVTELAYLKDYCLDFFVGELSLPNPLQWHEVHETKWAKFLLKHSSIRATKTKRDVVNALNRFMPWLHKRYPDVPVLKFDPISRAKYAEAEARREGKRVSHFIPDADLKSILDNAPSDIRGALHLLARYGLRRNESIGLLLDDVKKGHLAVDRQRVLKEDEVNDKGKVIRSRFAPTKGREKRKTPHWYATAAQAYDWIDNVLAHPMHPRTFAEKWDKLIKKLIRSKTLTVAYKLHDLRHTFITRAVRAYSPRDVQLAVGHKDLRITMSYLRDDRELADEVWKPTG